VQQREQCEMTMPDHGDWEDGGDGRADRDRPPDDRFARAGGTLCLLDDEGRLVAVSAGFTVALGWTGDELRGRALADIIHPDDQAGVTAALAELDGWVGAGSAEARVRRKSGADLWLVWRFARPPEGPGVRASAVALSPQQQRDVSLRQFFDLALEILCIWRGADRFAEVNPAFSQMLGWSRDELMSKSMRELIHPDDLAATFALSGQLLRAGQIVQFENRYVTRDGGYKWISWSYARDPVDSAIYATGRDVSHFKEILEELRSAKDLAEQAMSAAETAGRGRNAFLSNMSHELRTPLNGVLGYAQLLALDADLTDKQRDAIDAIRRSGEHLLVLINDMLDLAKMEAGTLTTSANDMRLGEFLANVTSTFEARARGKGIGFGYQALTVLPEVIRCDETRLRQVLVNLLSTAIRGREHGGVFLGVGFSSGALRFRIEEAPSGLSSAESTGFFAPLPRLGEHGEPTAGTVLDLPARLLHLVGGDMAVERRGDGRNVYWVEIKLEAVDGWAPTASAARVIEGYEGARRIVLVADDNQDNRSLLVRLLEPLGFGTVEAGDGAEALRLAQAALPDVIFMDLVMPVLDGFEATRRLRAAQPARPVPVIAMSTSAFEPDRNRSLLAGCDGFLAKPVRRDRLLSLLEQHLDLTWRYRSIPGATPPAAAPAQTRASSGAPLADEPATLSLAQLRVIHEAASIGDIRAILTIVESAGMIEDQAARVAPPGLVDEIHRLAKRFQARKIKERIETFLDQT
jgi:PAS domain S-box-containing protein